jgi:hypothetical protein
MQCALTAYMVKACQHQPGSPTGTLPQLRKTCCCCSSSFRTVGASPAAAAPAAASSPCGESYQRGSLSPAACCRLSPSACFTLLPCCRCCCCSYQVKTLDNGPWGPVLAGCCSPLSVVKKACCRAWAAVGRWRGSQANRRCRRRTARGPSRPEMINKSRGRTDGQTDRRTDRQTDMLPRQYRMMAAGCAGAGGGGGGARAASFLMTNCV